MNAPLASVTDLACLRLLFFAVPQPADAGPLVKGWTLNPLRLRCRSQYVTTRPVFSVVITINWLSNTCDLSVSTILAGMKRSTGLT